MLVPTSEVGSKETDEKADEVLKLDILDCWTPDNHYRWSKSKCSQTFRGRPSVVIVWRPTIQNIQLQNLLSHFISFLGPYLWGWDNHKYLQEDPLHVIQSPPTKSHTVVRHIYNITSLPKIIYQQLRQLKGTNHQRIGWPHNMWLFSRTWQHLWQQSSLMSSSRKVVSCQEYVLQHASL